MMFLAWVQPWYQLAQTVQTAVAPITLGTLIELFAGIAMLFVLNLVMKTARAVTNISIALFGNPAVKETTGLVHDAIQAHEEASHARREATHAREEAASARTELLRFSTDFGRHVIEETKWQLDLSADVRGSAGVLEDMAPRLKAVERHVQLDLNSRNNVQRKPRS